MIARLFRRARHRIGALLHSFRFTMVGSVFLIMLASGIIASATVTLVSRTSPEWLDSLSVLELTLIISPAIILLGTVFSIIVSKQILRPIDDMIRATEEISRGNFAVQVPIRYEKNQFTRLITSFNAMVRELSGIEIFRNDFINNFSHEFKTPLSNILGFARELARGGLSDAEREEYIEIIISACERLRAMSTSVLLLSKLENQHMVTELEEYELDEQLRDAILLLEKEWSRKEIELVLHLDRVSYTANREMLMHVWLNLLSNAVKFCPASGGVITVVLRQSERSVIVSVRDNGCGMAKETVAHIFEKFYQGDTSHKAEGNGLGLPLVARIVTLAGGRVEVESTEGQGSTFRVRLPKNREE